jgi:predicted O-methyltransferase YrrM
VLKLKLKNSQDIFQFRKMYIPSIALNTALELGIFWQLSNEPHSVDRIAQINKIPLHRSRTLLELLTKLGLLEKKNEMYKVSTIAQKAILEGYSAETWAFLAKEAQDRYPLLNNLTSNITYPDDLWNKHSIQPPNWFGQMVMVNSPEYAKKFTYGLYEHHLSFAKKFAQIFDMSGVDIMMDIGGGSGVMSLELLKRHSHLRAVVIDIENVCTYGREIAAKTSMKNRISYEVLDFLKDELPKGFDLILQCDAGIHSKDFFNKLRRSLTDSGCLVIITNIDDDSDWLNYPNRQESLYKSMNRFYSSLEVPSVKRRPKTIENVKQFLLKGGFQKVEHDVWDKGEVIIQAFI